MKSNQRITKIKLDPIEALLVKAEGMNVEDATTIQDIVDLIPYPDMNYLRNWVREYCLKGINSILVHPINKGQSYLTTIVDGLPLFTKMTKTNLIAHTITEEPYDSSEHLLTENGTLGGSVEACSSSGATSGKEAYMAFDGHENYATKLGTKYYETSTIPTTSKIQYLTFYTPQEIIPTEFVLYLGNNTSSGTQYAPYNFKVEASLDGEVWTTLNTVSKNTNYKGLTLNPDTDQKFKYYRMAITQATGTASKYKAHVRQWIIKGHTHEENDYVQEVSKPGLLLSNLTSPYYASDSVGGYLRQNFIHEKDDAEHPHNQDFAKNAYYYIIGHYAYSFFQRGVIHRDDGSSHDNNDSFCQHWSPSALGCMSHESIVIPLNNLRSTYTSYQTLTVPVDENAQFYKETPCKDVNYLFADDNNTPENTSTAMFNGRVVGSGWSYEFAFKTTKGQSGGTIGGCMTGTMTYGDGCTQDINSCFISSQAAANGEAGDPMDTSNAPCKLSKRFYWEASCQRGWSGAEDGSLWMPECSTEGGHLYLTSFSTTISNCEASEVRAYIHHYGTIPNDYGTICKENGGTSVVTNTASKDTTPDTRYEYPAVSSNSVCNMYGGTGTCFYNFVRDDGSEITPTSPATDKDIYFNIIDQKREYEAQGIPFPNDCDSIERFRFEWSDTKCTGIGCESIEVAKAVSITELGVIAGLIDQEFKG